MTTATATHSRPFNPARVAPDAYAAMTALQSSVTALGLDPVLSELLKIRVSQINGCAFCLIMHTTDARAAGEAEHRIYALNAWRETTFYSARERAALALAEAITLISEGHVPDHVLEEAARHFSEEEVAAITWSTIAINSWNRLSITARTQPRTPR